MATAYQAKLLVHLVHTNNAIAINSILVWKSEAYGGHAGGQQQSLLIL